MIKMTATNSKMWLGLFALVLSFSSFAVHAKSPDSECDSWLKPVLQEFTRQVHRIGDENDQDMAQMLLRIFKVDDDHHDHAFEIESPSGLWLTNHTTLSGGHDPLGDSRWPLLVLGPHLGAQLQFQEEGGVLGVPSRDGFLTWFKTLFPNIKVKPSISFYAQVTTALQAFLRTFADTGALPLADPRLNINHYLHDLNYHLAAIFLPEAFIDHLQLRTKTYLDLADHLRTKYPFDHPLRPELDRRLRIYENVLAKQIDEFTAQVTILILFNLSYENGIMSREDFKTKRESWLRSMLANVFGTHTDFVDSNLLLQPLESLVLGLHLEGLLLKGEGAPSGFSKVLETLTKKLKKMKTYEKYQSGLVNMVERGQDPVRFTRDYLENGIMARRQAVINAARK